MISNLRSGGAQKHIARDAEHSPCLIASDCRELVKKRIHGLIVFEKLEQYLYRNRRSYKDRATTPTLRIEFDYVCELHYSNPIESAEALMRRTLLRTQPGPPPGQTKMAFLFS